MRTWLMFAACLISVAATAGDATSAHQGLHENVTFDTYSPLSGSSELVRRFLSPFQEEQIRARLTQTHQTLQGQSIDLAQEHFAVYVPPDPPPQGYALLVFVPPWEDARVPPEWLQVLNRHHMILVTAAHSGNAADTFDRREPLALLAAYNVMQRYRVDPTQIYVGGFSGGARIALRLALGYPDLFRGALLDAGSDPIGTEQIPLPPKDLLHRFQQSSRLVLLVGTDDRGPGPGRDALIDRQPPPPHADLYEHEHRGLGLMSVLRGTPAALHDAHGPARASLKSLRGWCVQNLDVDLLFGVGHALADAHALDHALAQLTSTSRPDIDKLTTCRAGLNRQVDAQLQQARSLLDHRQPQPALDLLKRIDMTSGWLAAPRSVELLHAIKAHPTPDS